MLEVLLFDAAAAVPEKINVMLNARNMNKNVCLFIIFFTSFSIFLFKINF
jgi:hypothetical protein